jgi:hypothetical protein
MGKLLQLRGAQEGGYRPGDLLCYQLDVALDSDSAASVDLRGIVRKGAPVWYRVFTKATTNSTTGVLAADDDASVASATHTMLIFFEGNDSAQAGE